MCAEGQDWGAKRAAKYDQRIREIFPAYEELHAHAVGVARCNVGEGGSILVVGAGTGFEALLLARVGFRVVAIDPSGQMLLVGRAQAESGSSIEFVQAYLEDLPAVPSFDAITSMLVMHFISDDGTKLAFLSEAAKRCCRGGTLILADLIGEPGTPEFESEFQTWKISLAQRSNPHEIERDLSAIKRDVHFIPSQRLTELMAEAGWMNPTVQWHGGLLQLWSAVRA